MNWRNVPLDIIVGVEEKRKREESKRTQIPLYMPPPEPPHADVEEVTGSDEKPERGVTIIDYSID